MTAENVTSIFQNTSRRSRGAFCVRVVAFDRPPNAEGAGKAGCPPHPRPPCMIKSTGKEPQVSWIIRPSLRDGFTAYSALSPGTGLSCPCREQIVLLTWPQRREARTTRLCRPRYACVRLTQLTRPSHPASNVRDDREAPLMWVQDGADHGSDLGSASRSFL